MNKLLPWLSFGVTLLSLILSGQKAKQERAEMITEIANGVSDRLKNNN